MFSYNSYQSSSEDQDTVRYIVLVTGFYTQSDFRAGLLRREAAVATAWPTLVLTELPAGASSGGWICLGDGGRGGGLTSGGIGGDFPSGRKRTSPGGEIWQLFFGK